MEELICKAHEYCGSCKYQGVEYKKQLEIKQNRINSLLKSFGNVSPIIGMDNPYHYRNKIQVPFSYDENHNVIYGNYIEGTHIIVNNDECLLCDEKSYEIIRSVKRLIDKYKITIFNEDILKGCIRHLLVRCTNAGEYMLVIVTGSFKINRQEQFIKDILKFNPCVKTIIQNINNRHTSMVLGPKNIVLYGKGYIVDKLCGMDFRISPSSFYQVNKRQTEVLYNTAIKLANLNKNETLIDAYCGTGTIGLVASKYVKNVIGVELNESAIKDAIINKKINKVDNIDFICDDAGRFMNYLASKKTHIDAVIMDPPRSGSDIKFMRSMVSMNPDKIVYISCGPDSLKEDLKYLTKFYKVEKIQPVDMFAFTAHVETVVLLVLRNPVKHIDVSVDVDEMVDEKRENFNKGEGNSKELICPPKKRRSNQRFF